MRKEFLNWLEQVQPDVLCLQETKANYHQIDTQLIEDMGYYHFWNSARKKGYSGVSIWTRKKPIRVVYGAQNPNLLGEGRIIQVDFENISIISVYVPSATNMDRLGYKMQFCQHFAQHIEDLTSKGHNLVISGDYNICHQAIDIHDPVRLANVSGFLPEEREWLDNFIHTTPLVDSFRAVNTQPHQYTWWSYRANARNNNKGWRIDYQLISPSLEAYLQRSIHLPDAMHSDHCPTLIELQLPDSE